VLVADDVGDPYAPSSLASEGFVHCSYAPSVHETVALYFAADARLRVLEIDPRLLTAAIDVAETPRGPMPHVLGPIPRSAVVAVFERAELPGTLPDEI
jgi:uncharacterized protein (DUF952 family)